MQYIHKRWARHEEMDTSGAEPFVLGCVLMVSLSSRHRNAICRTNQFETHPGMAGRIRRLSTRNTRRREETSMRVEERK